MHAVPLWQTRGLKGRDVLHGVAVISVRSLVPISIGVLAAGLLTGYLLVNDVAIGPWVLAALLVAHGALHVAFAVPGPSGATDWPFDVARSWTVTRAGLDALVRRIERVLVVAILVGFVLAALCTVGLAVPADWWTALVVAAASLSFVLLAIAFAATLLVGFGIDLALIAFALSGLWTPASALG